MGVEPTNHWICRILDGFTSTGVACYYNVRCPFVPLPTGPTVSVLVVLSFGVSIIRRPSNILSKRSGGTSIPRYGDPVVASSRADDVIRRGFPRAHTRILRLESYNHYNAHDEHVMEQTMVTTRFPGEQGVFGCNGTLRGDE